MKTYIPTNLDLQKILTEDPPAFKHTADEFNYILGTLARLRAQHKDYQDDEFTPLNAQLMQERIKTYNKHMDYLVNKGVLESDRQYIVGKKSKGYKFAEEHIQGGFKKVAIKQKKLTRVRPKEQLKLDALHTQYSYLTQWFNKKLKIDYNEAYNAIMNMAVQEEMAGEEDAQGIAQHRLLAVEMLRDGVYNLSVDDNIHRFHSILTNLKKELRNYITYGGERLCAIDISNSQPFFSIVLFNPDFYAKADGFTLYGLSSEVYSSIEDHIQQIQTILTPHPFIMLVKPHEREATNDLELYCTLVDKGRLYNYISDKYFEATGKRYDLTVPAEKDKLKTAMFYTIYSRNDGFSPENGDMKRLFRSLFPTVYKVFFLLKKGKHQDLATTLQRIESDIVVRTVARHIAQQRPDIPLFTIHDSIVTTVANKEYVYSELKQTCERAIGLMPTLKFEEWG